MNCMSMYTLIRSSEIEADILLPSKDFKYILVQFPSML